MSAPLHRTTVPPPDGGAHRPWRKLLHGLDHEMDGGRICLGDWLDCGAVYDLPAGSLIVGVDRQPGGTHNRVRIWRVTTKGDLKTERDTVFKAYRSAFGPSVRGTLQRLVDKYPPRGRRAPLPVKAAPPRPNDREGFCDRCRQTVPAGAGLLSRTGLTGTVTVTHRPGE